MDMHTTLEPGESYTLVPMSERCQNFTGTLLRKRTKVREGEMEWITLKELHYMLFGKAPKEVAEGSPIVSRSPGLGVRDAATSLGSHITGNIDIQNGRI